MSAAAVEVLDEPVLFAMIYLRNRSSTTINAVRVPTWAINIHSPDEDAVRSTSTFLGAVPGFLQCGQFVHILRGMLFVFVYFFSLIGFRVYTCEFSWGDISRVFLPAWGHSCKKNTPRMQVERLYPVMLLQIVFLYMYDEGRSFFLYRRFYSYP